ncbi:MAG TPA: glycoside hydrolase family 43 protein [Actinomycetota bacterium]|nr:glycoside hydrolase family 43 protein [Actinomycetota bacterium]
MLGRRLSVAIGAALAAGGCMSALAPPTAVSQTETYANPIYRHNAPDPSLIRAGDGTFYAFTTQSFYDGEKVNIPIIQSTDLLEWSFVGDAFPQLPAWALKGEDADTWAPHVIHRRGTYYLYFAARSAETRTMGIGVATAEHPAGPWKARRRPLITGPRYTTIDPFVWISKNGRPWLYWGSGGVSIRAQRLTGDGLGLIGPRRRILTPSTRPYEKLVEAPWLVHRKGFFYLFYSGDRCCYAKAHYAVLVARSRSKLGPFKRFAGNPIVEANRTFKAPGHIATVADEQGRCWLLYHAMDAAEDTGLRYLMLDRIRWRRGWPQVNEGMGPTTQSAAPSVGAEMPRFC